MVCQYDKIRVVLSSKTNLHISWYLTKMPCEYGKVRKVIASEKVERSKREGINEI